MTRGTVDPAEKHVCVLPEIQTGNLPNKNQKSYNLAKLHSFWLQGETMRQDHYNLLNTKRNLLYMRSQSAPRCKHFPQRL